MRDAVVVGGGLAGLAAAWRLRFYDTLVLESEDRVGGRVKSERRGNYWMNWGGHMFAGGPGTATQLLLDEVGVAAEALPGRLTAFAMNGKTLQRGHLATYPLRLPMPFKARFDTYQVGVRLAYHLIGKYINVVRVRPGESAEKRQQRVYDFENTRTFQDFLGDVHPDSAAIFASTVTRSSGNMDQVSAGAGIGYFSLVLGIGAGLSFGIVGGPSTLTETIAASLGEDRVQLGAKVNEVVRKDKSVVVRYTQGGVDKEVEARTVVLACTADVSHKIAVNIPEDLRDALGKINYGPHVSTAFLTNETGRKWYDDVYAVTCPKRSFAIATNQASIVRGKEKERQPGGSWMVFSPARLGYNLLDKSDEEVAAIHLKDLDEVLGGGFANNVVEAQSARWRVASPYNAPGRAKIQPTLMRGTERIYLAGDYTGTLYTESSVMSGMKAAQDAASVLATERQTRNVL